jgi:hypothetical protein
MRQLIDVLIDDHHIKDILMKSITVDHIENDSKVLKTVVIHRETKSANRVRSLST